MIVKTKRIEIVEYTPLEFLKALNVTGIEIASIHKTLRDRIIVEIVKEEIVNDE